MYVRLRPNALEGQEGMMEKQGAFSTRSRRIGTIGKFVGAITAGIR